MEEPQYSIGVDIGGTFTDAVAIDPSGRVFAGKADTTPTDITRGVVGALEETAKQIGIGLSDLLGRTVFFGHGTTVGTNALITKGGGRVGLLVTRGFEDTPYIQRSVGRLAGLNETQVKNQVALRQPSFLIDKKYVRGVTERIDCFGEVLVPLVKEEAAEQARSLLALGVDAVAICLLWSFANNRHERELAEIVKGLKPDVMVTTSSDLIPKLRENARLNSTVINCYVGSTVAKYLSKLKATLQGLGLSTRINVMQVFGGLADIEAVHPIYTIDSGPVGGVIGAQRLSQVIDEPNLITTDVGGTSFDVSVIHGGKLQMAKEYFGATGVIDRFEVLIPRVDIKVIGAGGGSIARYDEVSRTIKLGPESAGADPGPIFYDKGGTAPTLADAWLVLGFINPENFLAGRKRVNVAKTFDLFEAKLARPMQLSVHAAAAAVVELADNAMSDTVRERLVEKGYDRREFSLLAFGGAGLLHASSYGRLLGVKKIILARNASVFSALGIALSDVVSTFGRSVLMPEPFEAGTLREALREVRDKLGRELACYGDAVAPISYSFQLEMKYRGQIHELSIPIEERDLEGASVHQDLKRRFSARYEELYGRGSGYEKGGVEIIGVNGRAVGEVFRPSFSRTGDGDSNPALEPGTSRRVFLEGSFREVPIYDSEGLRPNGALVGPAIVEYPDTTALVLEGQSALVDGFLNLHVS